MLSTKASNSSLIALAGGITGLATAIVFLPLGVSKSNEKTFLSLSSFSLITSAFFL